MTLFFEEIGRPSAWRADLSGSLELRLDDSARQVLETTPGDAGLAGLGVVAALVELGLARPLAQQLGTFAPLVSSQSLRLVDDEAGLQLELQKNDSGRTVLRIERAGGSDRPQADRLNGRSTLEPTLETVLDNVPLAVFWKDAGGRYAGANARFRRVSGLPSTAPLAGRTDTELAWSALAEDLQVEDRRVLRGDVDQLASERVVQRDGQDDLCLALTKAPLRDASGAVAGILGFCDDITARFQHTRELERIADAFAGGGDCTQLQALVRAAAQLGGTRFAMLARLDDDGTGATVLAFHPPQDAMVGLHYDLAGTPCEQALAGDVCHIPEAVTAEFPDDPMLTSLEIEAYFGRRLVNAAGQPAAVFALMHDEPFDGRADLHTVLDIFASRALVEIERDLTLTEFKTTQARLGAALQSGAVGIWEWDPAIDRIATDGLEGTFADSAAVRTLTSSELFAYLSEECAAHLKQALRKYLRGETALVECEIRVCDNTGVVRDLSVRGHRPPNRTGDSRSLVGTVTDITAIKRTQSALEQAHRFQNLVLDTVPQWVFWQDRDLRYLGCNRRFAEAAGLPEPAAIVGIEASDLTFGIDVGDFSAADARLLDGDRESLTHEIEFTDAQGRRGWLDLTKVPMRDGAGRIIGLLGTAHNVTRQKEAEQSAQRLAFFDPLTKLANRRFLIERLGAAIATASRQQQTGALLFIDMDEFKQINDSLGHSVGDALLQKIAWRLGNCTRTDDTVARLGGDEFVVLLPAVGKEAAQAIDHAQRVADKISSLLGQPYRVDNHVFHVTPTIGITLFPEGGKTVDDVLKEADTAMYCGKNAGRNQTKFFAEDMQADANRKIQLASDIRVALERDEFGVHYQAQVDGSGRSFGAEALVRWNRPGIGFVSPADFIPVAESRGVIGALGQWVIDHVFTTARQWLDDEDPALDHVSINVSSRQFRSDDFVDSIALRLEDHGIPPGFIMLEVTEGTVIEDVQGTIEKMKALRELGVRFAMDDFGTGYSSLAYLKALPIDQLKIDRSFIRDIGRVRDDEVICETVIAMGQHLGLQVIAEGVETEEQFEFLRLHGCDGFQGYYFMRPGPADELVSFTRRS